MEISSLMPKGEAHKQLISLPSPQGAILAAVYDFRDQTGQYKGLPSSNFSTAVPQSGASMLSQALVDSAWFTPVEREGLQNLLTERKIIRAGLQGKGAKLSELSPAQILFEGGIIAYDTNTITGGLGARYLGIGANSQFRKDSVTVNLRAVDIRTGRVLSSVTTTKSILSKEISAGVFKFIAAKELLESEMGYTTNEPVSICVDSAINAALTHLISDGVWKGAWSLKDEQEGLNNPVLLSYWVESFGKEAVQKRLGIKL
ncbi:CsgG/HfaB family protein [Paraferrimonas sp. SM1919]|uniref:CsgG/HfaB family protein n=1 Tax=Paraferrimonas sp. SM1919 TaxID=2662263 RepID=UPI0034CEE974